MKFQLVSVALLLVIGGAWTLQCKVCDEGMIDPGLAMFEDIPAGDTTHLMQEACPKDSDPPTKTCSDDEDVCVTHNLEYHYTDTTDNQIFNVKLGQYRCGKESEVVIGENQGYCESEEERMSYSLTGLHLASCKAEVTKKRETGGGKTDGEDEGTDCRNEMCSGAENAKLKVILATASVVLFGILSC